MRLPRRVPWATLAELDQVCNWIYADDSDLHAKLLAVNRLSAWRVVTPLPHALESTLYLLSSLLLDQQSATPLQSSALNSRQSYATAIVRLVNGLVDPLQLGTYARSIASIAAQIGLPHRLVELRHAATHEELPSLEVLRTGAKESLAWLFHNYFLPTLSASSNANQSSPAVHLSPLAPLLKQYKSLMKTLTRDASLKSQYKGNLTKVLRDVERWLGEAKVAASAEIFNGWGAGEQGEGDEESERWALERLCEALLERGGLIPVSSRKRLASKSKSLSFLPSSLVAIWSPLLSALNANHPFLPSVLVSTITNTLIYRASAPVVDVSQKKDLSFDLCLAAWAAWCVDQWDAPVAEGPAGSATPLKRKDVVVVLVTALGARRNTEDRRGVSALLDLLVLAHPDLKDITDILPLVSQPGTRSNLKNWSDEDALVMEERLHLFLSAVPPAEDDPGRAMDVYGRTDSQPPAQILHDELPRGWARVAEGLWKTCPIGAFVK